MTLQLVLFVVSLITAVCAGYAFKAENLPMAAGLSIISVYWMLCSLVVFAKGQIAQLVLEVLIEWLKNLRGGIATKTT